MALSRRLLVAVALAGCAGATRAGAPLPASPPAPASAKQNVPAYGPKEIDAALDKAWGAQGIVPAPRCDDATFLRRAYLDIIGTIPTPDVALAFSSDPDPDKRAKLTERLLASPDYAEHWTAYWDDVLMGRQTRANLVDRNAFRQWLHARFAENTPWDRLVRDLVAATGQNSAGGAKRSPNEPGENVNGAVNWTLRFEQSPQDLAGNASRIFLGVQIQCAQCHDHKSEKWKQEDFRKFASAFLHLRPENLEDGKVKGMIRRFEISDFDRVPPRFAKNAELAPIAKSKATALDGQDLEKGTGTRKALAAWMTSKDNAWFAKAFVNRMWGHFLGRGFVDPVDDIRESNPATQPEILDALAKDFAASGFDVKRLVRAITATKAYGLAASAPGGDGKADPENKLWSRFHLVPLGPEELLNAIFRATKIQSAAERAGIANIEELRAQVERQYGFLFDVDEESDAPDFSGSVSQALTLLNGQLVGQGSRAIQGSALDEILATQTTEEARIEALVVRVLSRKPTESEKAKWLTYVDVASRAVKATIPPPKRAGAGGGPLGRLRDKNADGRRAAYEDVLWALLNSSEFTFNH